MEHSVFKVEAVNHPELERLKEKIIPQLNEFFGTYWTTNTPKIFLIDDRETYNKLWYQKGDGWNIAFIVDRLSIFMLNPDTALEHSNHTEDTYDLEKLIRHELCHCYFDTAFGEASSFPWVYEGVSVYFAGQLEMFEMPAEEFKGFLDGKYIYHESGQAIHLLIENFGKEKLFEFLRKQSGVKETSELKDIFEKVFSKKLEYSFFNELLKKSKK